jgi:cell division protein FtsB
MKLTTERTILYGLIILLLLLQYPLWFGNSSVFNIWRLKKEISVQGEENRKLEERNRTLAAEVADLKKGLAAIEERSRSELGMIKKNETFFHVIEPADKKKLKK